jgi:hypothetical protein
VLTVNARTIPSLVLLIVVAMSASGCCTYRLTKYCHRTTIDTFVPAAVYQATNSARLALEGTLHLEVTKECAEALNPRGRGAVRRCLLFPEGGWQSDNSPTNCGPWLTELENAWPKLAKDSRFEDTVPPNCIKVADLPATFTSLPTAERRHRSAWIVLTPLTAMVDIATSPIQLTVCAVAWLLPPS